MRFEVLAGNHVDLAGKLYNRGEVITTNVPLDKKFVNKFKRLGKAPKDKKKKKKDKGKRKARVKLSAASPAAPDAQAAEARGTNVTDQFESVANEGLLVFKRGPWHHVYDGDNTTPLNDKGLKKAKVEEFVTAHLEE